MGDKFLSTSGLSILVASLAVTIAFVMRLFSRKNRFPVDGRTVLITGGSQGMGRGVARLLATKGASIVIVARDVNKLKAAKEYIAAAAVKPTEQRFHYISADMMDASECARVLREVTTWNDNRAPDIVWCIAGSAYPHFFIDMDTDRLRQQMDQNYLSAAYMAHATLKEWLQPYNSPNKNVSDRSASAEPRHLIFTSSVAAFCSLVGYSAYAPAKAALRSLSDALSQELNLYNASRRHHAHQGPQTDVRIHTVFPATILTPGFEQESLVKPAITKKLEESDKGQTEDEVAAESVKALEKGEYLVTTTFLGSLMRGPAWGVSPRNNWFLDTVLSCIMNVACLIIQPDLDGKVAKWGREHGHPATYKRS